MGRADLRRAQAREVPFGLRRGPLTGLLVLVALAAVALGAVSPILAGPTPPPGLAASASVEQVTQYLADSTGVTRTFSIHNTGSVSIGAVQIARPTGWTVTACPDAPTGWTAKRSGKWCRFQSAAGSGDDIPAGATWSDFQVRATTSTFTANRVGAWQITVSKSSKFDGPSRFRPAAPEGSGLTSTANAWRVLDAAVGDAAVGDACPAATLANHTATAASTQTIVVCGRNLMSVAGTPVAGESSLDGSFLTSPASGFAAGSIPAGSGNVVLAKWTNATIAAPGTGLSLEVQVGSAANSDSPVTTLDDSCAPGDDCIDNGGYVSESGGANTPPVANDDAPSVSEDSTGDTVNVLANDTDADLDTLTVLSVDITGTTGVVMNNGTEVTYDPNGQFESLNTGETATDTFTYTVSDGNGGTDTATVTVTITGVTDPPVDSAPTVTATTPTNGATNVPVDTNIDVTFSESVAASGASFSLECPAASPKSFAVTGSPGTTITINPTSDLPAGTTCVVTVLAAGISDTDADDPPDNPAANFVFSFTTDAAPTVTSTTPAHGAVDVAVGTSIDVTFSEPVAASGSSFTLECPAATPIAFSVTGSPGTTITIDPTSDLPAGTPCDVTVLAVGISDTDTGDPPDNLAANFLFSFTTGSAPADTAPTVTQTTPANGATNVPLDSDIDVTFSESVAASGSSFTLECPAAVAFTVSGSPGTSIQLDPIPPLPVGSTCTVTVLAAGISDSDANDPPDNLAANFVFSFQTVASDTAPTAVDDAATVNEDSGATAIGVLPNDTDPDGGPMFITSASDPANGTVTLTGGNPGEHTGLTYQPDGNYCNDPPGTTLETFTYTLNGGSTATVTVTVTCVDDAPQAVNDTATVAQDSGATAIGVLPNDTDVDGGPKTIASNSDPANGTVTLTGGSPGEHTGLTYQPDPGYCNTGLGGTPDTFTYTLNLGSTATVSVTVTCAGDDPPTAVNDAATVAEDATATAIDVLANDQNADGGPMAISSTSDPANGTVVPTGGSPGAATGLTYEPDPDFCNDPPGTTADEFTYTLNGGSTATVSVSVTCVNDAPVVTTTGGQGSYVIGDPATAVDTGLTVQDVDSGTLAGATVVITTGAQALDTLAFVATPDISGSYTPGTFTLTLTGVDSVADYQAALRSVQFSASSGAGDRTIAFTVNDGALDSNTANRVIDVALGNSPPVANDDSGAGFTTDEDTAFTTGNVLTNDTDANVGDTLSVQSIDTTGTKGLVTNNSDGTFGYDPNGQFESLNTGDTDSDTFTYTVSDGNGGTDTATVTITITGVTDGGNVPPVANDDGGQFFTTDENATNFNMGNVLDNDTDANSDTLTVTGFDAITTKGGAISQVNNGLFAYDAKGLFESLQQGESDTDTFTYTIDDGNGGTDTATVTITINGVNDNPDAVDDGSTGFVTSQSAPFTTGSVLANDTDVESDTLIVISMDDTATLGNVINNLDGTFQYDPAGAFNGLGVGESDTDTFTYTISDGNGGSDTATVTITVNGANDLPDAVDDTPSTDEDTPVTISVLANDTDVDVNDTLTITGTGALSNGGSVQIVNGNTQIEFTPGASFQDLQAGQTRQTAFTYSISDGNGGTDTATVTVTVNGINDAPVADDDLISGADAAVGNTTLIVNDPTDGAPTGPAGPKKSVTGDVLDGDTDVDGPNALVIQAGTFATNGGGSVTIEADGDFVFTPAAGTSCNAVSDFFDYTISDGAPSPLTDVGRVTISLSGCVWYVRNNAGAGGDGRSATPFNTLAAAETPSLAGHWIYVHAGDGTTAGLGAGGAGAQFSLDNDQRFIGEAVALVVNGATLNPAGARPNIGLGLALGSNDTVTGVSLASNAVAGILAGGGDLHGTIDDVVISSNFGGIALQGSGGIWTIANVSVTSSLLDGIQLSSAGQVTFTDTGTISVTVTGGRGIAFSGATTTLAGTIDSVTASGTATTGIFIDDTLGSLTINDVNLTTTAAAIDIDSANDITITNTGDADVSSTGIAIDVSTDGANPANGVDIALDQVSSSGGAAGIRLIDIGNGTFSAAGGTLAGHTTASIDIDFGSGNVTYPGPINNGTGLSVDITNRSGGTVSLGGAITDSNDVGGGINLDNNDNSTVTFGGNLVLITTTGAGFVAVNGGTVNATGTASSITTTTGTGVNISGTTIGASNVTFDTVNVDGDDVNPTNGILVNGTGAVGSFSVTGTGSAGTGGTVRDASGDGIRLVNTLSPSIQLMTVTSNLGSGIQVGGVNVADAVTNGTLQNLVVSANGNDSGAEDGIKAQNLIGTASFTNLDVSGSARHNVSVTNNTGVLTSLAISGSSIHDNAATSSNGLVLIADGTATMTATIGTTNFTTNRVNGVLAQTLNAGTLTLTATGGTYTNNFVAFELTHASSGNLTGTLTGATITNAINGCSGTASPCGAPVNLFISNQASSNASSVLRATITSNTINNGGSANAPGIWMHTGTPVNGHARLLITNNTITNVNQNGIAVEGGGCISPNVCAATFDATIENNTITLGASGGDGVHFNIGTAGTAAGNNDTIVACGDIENNTISSGGADAVRLRHRSQTTIRLPGYLGTQFDTTAVATYLDGRNPAITDTFSAATSSLGGGFQNSPGGTACLLP